MVQIYITYHIFFKTLNIHIPCKNKHLTHFRQKCTYNIFALSHRDIPLHFKLLQLLQASFTIIIRYVLCIIIIFYYLL